jgi:hypothetical protein
MWTPKGYGDNQGWYKPSIAAPIVFDLAWTAGASDASSSTTVNYGSLAIGAADTNRIVVVAIASRMTTVNTISSVTIGGVPATLVSGTLAQIGGTNGSSSAIYQAAVPTGTTATVSVTYGAAAVRSAVSVYRLITGTPTATSSNNANNVSTSIGGAVTVPSGGGGIALYWNQPGSVTVAWTNASEPEDYIVAPSGPSTLSTSKISGTGSLTVTATPSVGGLNQLFSAAAWGL